MHVNTNKLLAALLFLQYFKLDQKVSMCDILKLSVT